MNNKYHEFPKSKSLQDSSKLAIERSNAVLKDRFRETLVDYSNRENSFLNSIFLKIECFYTYFSLIFFTDALSFRSLFLSGEGSGQSGYTTPLDSLIGLTRYSIYAFALVMIVMRFKMIFPKILRVKSLLMLLLTAIAYFSYLWSDLPEFTTYYATFVVGTALFSLYFAGRYSFQEQIKILAWALGTIVVMSFFFTLLFPYAGIEQGLHAGAWRAMFWHKNNLGRYAALGVIVFSLMAQANRHYRKLLWFFAGFSVFLLILSSSKTALIVFFFSGLLLYLCYILSWGNIVSVPIFLSTFLLGCGATFLAVQSLEDILSTLGKGVTLSGRTDIWDAVIPHIWLRPYWGYGYAAFWLREGQGRYVWNDIGFKASHAHNGFLDLILELGFVSLVLFLISFVLVYARSLQLLKQDRSVITFFPLLFFSFFLMYNFSSSQVLQGGSLTWVIYMTLAFSLEDIAKSDALKKKHLLKIDY